MAKKTKSTSAPANEWTPSPAWKRSFEQRLLAWYADHRRDLPWRRDGDAYRVWISEVMLQQTQVETVKPYFERFTQAFPTVVALAEADEQQVLRLWEGLGYYRRARALHAAAKQIASEHDGKLPSDVATLQTLPGIGRYTAGAIASIAYGQPAPILEANTIRLLTRLSAYGDDPTKSVGQRYLWGLAETLLPSANFADFNQALMELGSLVCTPTEPGCDRCPVAKLCLAKRQGIVDKLAPTTKKLKFTEVRETAVVVRHQGKVLIRQCAEGERWAGLWDFPRFELESEGPLFAADEIERKVQATTGIACRVGGLLTTLKHGVTRFRITLDVYEATRTGGRLNRSRAPIEWRSPETLSELPLSTTGRKIAKLIAP